MTDINHFLEPGEIIHKKQNCALDQGLGNQSDGTLYLTNQQLIFQIQQSGIARGLDLKIQGQKDVKVEFIYIPLNLVRGVEKKGLTVKVQTEASLFQEVLGKTGIFSPKGEGRVFENGPSVFNFAMHIFVNKDEWVNEIIAQRDKVLAITIKETDLEAVETPKQYSQENLTHHTIKEKIVIREIVKIKCSYCGSLYEQTSNRCPHCGGKQ